MGNANAEVEQLASAVQPGARVEATDGRVGVVSELGAAEVGYDASHFVLQEGHLWGKRVVTLPLSAVDRVKGDTVYLKLDKKPIEKLPTIPLKKAFVKGGEDIELVIRVFDSPEKAAEALEFVEGLKQQRVIKILNAAILTKDEDGQFSYQDSKEITPKKGRILGAITGGLIGLLAGPGGVVGALAGLAAGGAAGKYIDEGFSDKFLENLDQYLQPGKAALMLLMEHRWAHPASEAMSDLGGYVFQQTISDRLAEDLAGVTVEE
jgi:uncharacterized membrane protein